MITVKINGENKKLPVMNDLTVNQYIEFIKTKMNIVDYMSICLGIEYKEAFDIKLKNIDYLNQRIGNVEDYSKAETPESIIIDDKVYLIKDIEISTVGQRFMIEENARKLKQEELFCFILAIGIVKDKMNIDDINEMKDKLMNQPYINVLPAGFFLAQRFLNGKKSAANYLRMLKRWISMRT